MNIQAGRPFGAQSMAAPLRRVLMRSAASAMRRAEAARMALRRRVSIPPRRPRSTQVFADLVAASGAEIAWLPRRRRRAVGLRYSPTIPR